MFLRIYNPVVFDDSDTHCYKLQGLTDQSTDATTPECYLRCQWRIQQLTDGGCQIFEIIYTHHSWHSYALEVSEGMLPRKILKSKASNDAFKTIFWPKYGRFFVLGTLNGGARASCDPLWIRHWVPSKANQWQLLTEGRLCSLLFAEI